MIVHPSHWRRAGWPPPATRAFLGSFRTTTALAMPGQRAGLVAAIFIVGYLAFRR
jgi:hypothetical protein